jgi:hypothetical protein
MQKVFVLSLALVPWPRLFALLCVYAILLAAGGVLLVLVLCSLARALACGRRACAEFLSMKRSSCRVVCDRGGERHTWP